jgi:HTH-type transcriptional regulator/antitoxin HigA
MANTIKLMSRLAMTIKPIRSDEDLREAFQRLELIFQAEEGTPEADEMEIRVTLIESYENKHYLITPSDPMKPSSSEWINKA